MIKAVTLNKVEHAHLLKFITEYVDESGRNNMSSGIRFLMEKGFESLQNEQNNIINDMSTEDIKKAISEDLKKELKQELKSELTSELNSSVLNELSTAIDKLGNIQTVSIPTVPAHNDGYEHEHEHEHEQKIVDVPAVEQQVQTQPKIKKKKTMPNNIPPDSLLANLIMNSEK